MQFRMIRPYLPLTGVVLLAALVRFLFLGSVPVATYWDETSFGYNAYSLLKTGRDEYGSLLPVYLRSFDDYKLAGYAYLSIPFVWLFGLSAFSTRFASALLGTGTVLMTFFLVQTLTREIIEKSDQSARYKIPHTQYLAIISSFLLAISPWHIQFSRAGYEANAGLFFIVSGVWAFLIGMRQPKFLYVSVILFSLSLYFYRAAAIVAPLLGVVLLVLFRQQVNWKHIILAGIIGIMVVLPVASQMFSDEALKRNNQVSIANQYHEREFESAQKILENHNSLVSKVIYNRRLIYPTMVMQNIAAHFNHRYLFFDGDQFPRHGVRGMGILYLWELPGMLLGLGYYLLKRNWHILLFLFGWIVIGILPASLASPVPHALRSLYVLPVPMIFTATGILWIVSLLQKHHRVLFGIAIVIMIMGFFVKYLTLYYGDNKIATARDWGDGYPQLVSYVSDHADDYDQVIISGHYWKPYIYMLFYTQYDPRLFQEDGSQWNFDTYTFGGTGWGENEFELHEMDMYSLVSGEQVLIAFSPDEYEAYKDRVRKLSSIYSIDGTEMFIMAELSYDPK